MELISIYPEDIVAECESVAIGSVSGREERLRAGMRMEAQAVADIIHGLRCTPGPTKWLRLNHNATLSFFAFDEFDLRRRSERQIPQVVAYCRKRYSEVEYLLPAEQRPREWAKTYGLEIEDTLKLILDALTRCESRREHLVQSAATEP